MSTGVASVEWRRTSLTLALLLTIAVASFEATATSALMPSVVSDIGGRSGYPLVFALYAVAELFGLTAGPAVGRVMGPAGMFVAGALLHGAGLTLAGSAPVFGQLLAGRVVQGLGTGLVTVAVFVLIGYYPPDRRAALLGTMAAFWAVPGLAGPVVAGVVAELSSWRAVLLGVPVVELAALGLAAGGLREVARRRHPDRSAPAGRRLLPALAVAAGVLAVLNVPGLRPGAAWPVLGGAIVAIVAGGRMLLPAGALRFANGLPAVVMFRGVLAAPFISAQYLIPLSLAEGRGYNATGAGLALSSGVVGFSLAGLLYTRSWLARQDRTRLMSTGICLVAAGMAATALGLSPDRPVALVYLGWGIAGAGLGLAATTLNVVMLATANGDAERAAASSGMRIAESAAVAMFTAGSGLVLARAATEHTPVTTVAALVCAVLATLLVALLPVTGRLPGEAPAEAEPGADVDRSATTLVRRAGPTEHGTYPRGGG